MVSFLLPLVGGCIHASVLACFHSHKFVVVFVDEFKLRRHSSLIVLATEVSRMALHMLISHKEGGGNLSVTRLKAPPWRVSKQLRKIVDYVTVVCLGM